MIKKSCTKCGKNKLATPEYFYRKGTGLHSWCKSCHRKRDKEYESRSDRKIKRKELRGTPKNKKKMKEYQRQYNQQPKIKLAHREHHLKVKYDLTLGEHHLMYVSQNGKCAICKQLVAYNEIYTDHDHETGKVRGLLCHRCNFLLAGLDDKIFYKNAINYLKEN